MSLSAIRSESRKAARKSANEGRGPLLVEKDDMGLTDGGLSSFLSGIPFLGDRTPRGFSRVKMQDLNIHGLLPKARFYDDLFVDSGGWGSANEPALTFPEFLQTVRTLGPGFAYAIEESGQFQVNIRVMRASGN